MLVSFYDKHNKLNHLLRKKKKIEYILNFLFQLFISPFFKIIQVQYCFVSFFSLFKQISIKEPQINYEKTIYFELFYNFFLKK